MALTPDQLTRKHYSDLGYKVVKVESWKMYPELRRADFLGIFDYLAMNDEETIAIQTTTKSNRTARRKKMLSKKTFGWWVSKKARRRAELQVWFKNKSLQWEEITEELTLDQWEERQEEIKKEESVLNKESPLYKELFPND